MSQITIQGKDKRLGHSVTHPSKNRNKDVALLHHKLYLNLNRHIRHGRALKNIGRWRRVHKLATGVRQKAECAGKIWSFEKRIGTEIRVLKHVGFRMSVTF